MRRRNFIGVMGKKVTISVYIVILVFVVLILRLWDLQVIKGNQYSEMAENNRLRMIKVPAPRGIIYDRDKTPLVRNIPSFDISVAGNDLPDNDDTMIDLGKLIDLEPDKIRSLIENGSKKPLEPVKLKKGISFRELAIVEAIKTDFPGLQVDVVVDREYIYGEFASHIMGYLGRLTYKQSMKPEYESLPRSSFIGQLGIEKIYDNTLRGTAEKRFIEVDAVGRIIKLAGIQKAVKGDDITLTIDRVLQEEAEKSLRGMTGAVVVLDSNTGEVLAMASAPSYNPNLFARGIDYKDWQKLINNPMKPLLNRAIQSQYPPGSIFKMISALAALEEGVITEKTTYECKGSINLERVFRCWKEKGHGKIDVHRAIVESCDVFFYEVGKRIDIDTISRYALDFGLGAPVGIELEGERSGIVPSEEWKLRAKKERWYTGETLNTMIGQGYLTTTPIQIARYMAAVVNGGRVLKPYLIKNDSARTRVIRKLDLHDENVKLIMRSLVDVVDDNEGTGRLAHSQLIGIGGKTGTTQVVGISAYTKDVPRKYRDHAWFVAYAPSDNPQIVVAVFVEHGGHGSTVAAPIAKRIIEAYYNKNNG